MICFVKQFLEFVISDLLIVNTVKSVMEWNQLTKLVVINAWNFISTPEYL